MLILAGTNDIAQNTGPITQDEIAANISEMVQIARAAGIRVVLCSVLPASEFPWNKGLEPAPKVRALNAWLKDYAAKNSLVYVDYYSQMTNAEGGLKSELSPRRRPSECRRLRHHGAAGMKKESRRPWQN